MDGPTPPEQLRQEWNELAPAWIREVREGRNAPREGLLDAAMLNACGEVRGLRVLDCGCGEGRFCRLLAQRGAASVLGLDLCEPMIAAAREAAGEREAYRVADVEDLSCLDDGLFDLAVSYLNQCDLPNFASNNREVYRVLRPGGRFIVANLHPMRSAVGGWQRDADGGKLHVPVDRYFDEGERHWRMLGVDFTNFHRSLQTCLDSFRNAGFTIDRLIEPTVTAEQLEHYPELDDERRVPNFIVYLLNRP